MWGDGRTAVSVRCRDVKVRVIWPHEKCQGLKVCVI